MAAVIKMANKRASKITAEVITLTPQLAAEFLETNVKYQRHLTRNRVDQYALDIVTEDFVLSGQPIIFNSDGSMVDGQHRCAAVISADVAIPAILVVRGVQPDTFVALDTGKSRSASDVLSIEGYHYVHNLAATVRMLITYERYGELHSARRTSPAEILRTVQRNSRVEALTRFYESIRKYITPLGLGSRLSGLHLILLQKRVKETSIEEFVNSLIYGEGLKRTDPIYQFRQQLIEDTRSPGQRMTRRSKDARLIKTWNAWFTGNVGPNVTRWNGVREDYPVLVVRD